MWAILKKAKKMKNHVSLSSVSQDQLVVQDKNPDIQDMWEVINLLHDNNTITDRQYSWLKLKFEQDMTYEEIGKLHNISRQRANQIIDKAVFEIKKYYAHSTRNNK
jgi:DNA-directed RNA polymerase specialized sigma subunit